MRTADPGRLRCGGHVLASGNGRVLVQSTPAVGCPRCERGEGCGQALWGSRQRVVNLDLPGSPRAPGTAVELELSGGRLLRAAWLAYGLPLSGLLTGVIAAGAAALPDPAVLLAGAVGLCAGIAYARTVAVRQAASLAPVLGGPR